MYELKQYLKSINEDKPTKTESKNTQEVVKPKKLSRPKVESSKPSEQKEVAPDIKKIDSGQRASNDPRNRSI